jgi:hypothetical protein
VDDPPLTENQQRRTAELLDRWLERARVALSAYNDITTRTVGAERRLGIPAVVLSALVATGVFATLEKDPSLTWRIATGAVAVAASTLTALQTFLRHAERAEQYREAARSYGRLRRRIESAMLFPPTTQRATQKLLEELSEALAEAARGKPNVPQRTWDRAEYKIKHFSDARGLRAWRLRMADRWDYGVGERRVEPLDEDHARYFQGLDDAEVVEISRLRPARERDSQPASVATARLRMREAAAGKRERRPPLAVTTGPDGSFLVIDGNATFAVAEEDGWETVPVRLVGASPEDVRHR